MGRLLVVVLGVVAMACGGGTTRSGGGGGTGGTGDTSGTDGTEDGTSTGDDGGTCPNAALFADDECNPLCREDESDCPAGSICTFDASNAGFECFLVPTDEGAAAPLGKGCNDSKPCAEGACVEIPDVLGGQCAAFCGDDSWCDSESLCLLNVTYGGGKSIDMCIPKPPGCTVFDQGCEEEGKACYLAGEQSCLDAGEAKLGDDCNAPNDCTPGLICVSDRCHTPCNPKTNGPDPKCHLFCDSNEIQDSPDVAICSLPDNEPPCDLLNDECEDGEACYFTADGPRCRAPGAAEATAPCEVSEDCKPGYACWPSQTSCKAVCDKNDGIHDECESPNTAQCSSLPGTSAGFCDE